MTEYRSYEFPAAHLRVYRDRRVREFPKWTAFISIPRSREYAAEALRMLRAHRRIKRSS